MVNVTGGGLNTFKVRVQGTSYITPLNTFGIFGSSNAGAGYDTLWDFYVDVPQGKTKFDVLRR